MYSHHDTIVCTTQPLIWLVLGVIAIVRLKIGAPVCSALVRQAVHIQNAYPLKT